MLRFISKFQPYALEYIFSKWAQDGLLVFFSLNGKIATYIKNILYQELLRIFFRAQLFFSDV